MSAFLLRLLTQATCVCKSLLVNRLAGWLLAGSPMTDSDLAFDLAVPPCDFTALCSFP